MKKEIYCNHCAGQIEYREELVTVSDFFLLRINPYHTACYGSLLKGFSSLFMNDQPINGWMNNVATMAAIILSVVALFVIEGMTGIFFIVFTLFMIIRRGISWLAYERHLS
ncbi:MAG TPA: hypothetical protein VGI33_17075 [Paenibacillus sp.]